MNSLDILFQDEHYVVINKPSGLLVHRSEIDRHETRFAVQLLRDQLAQHVYPVHRLDKPTSGALLFALNPEAARRMAAQFNSKDVEKTYLTVVRGYSNSQGIIDYPLTEELDRKTDRKANPNKAPKEAVTLFNRLATAELPVTIGRYPQSRFSLIEARPQHGRKHQLRRHFRHLNHPIMGDTKHGEGRYNRFFRDRFDCHRLLLSAISLKFVHPYSQQTVRISAPLDETFQRVMSKMGWHLLINYQPD